MKKLLMIVSMVSCMSANALQLPQLTSIGMHHMRVPIGSNAVAYNGDRYDFSDKYESKVPTFNLRGSVNHLVDNDTLLRLNYELSTGHYSEAIKVSPSIKPTIELVKVLAEDMHLILNFELPTVGYIKEKKLIDSNNLDFSYATARPWSEYRQAEFYRGGRVNAQFQWKFHAPWGSKETNR